MSVTVVYPGTFDPITKGHEHLIGRASKLFSKVIVGVAKSLPKGTFFTLEERIDMAKSVLTSYPNVEVIGFAGLLKDFLARHDAVVILRGLRAASDFEYEFQMAGMNQILSPEVDTLFFTPGRESMFISSSLVREIALLGGDVSAFVSPQIIEKFHQKLAK
jgi:pantetheine-phosphate adenylyltransferase